MRLSRWPCALFTVITVPLAVNGDIEGILYVAVPIAVLADIKMSFSSRSRHVQTAYLLANGLALLVAIRPLLLATRSHILLFADDTFLYVSIASRTLSFVTTMLLVSKSSDATVIRTYIYVILMFITQVMAVLQLGELSDLVRVYNSVDATTRALCVEDSSSVTGFIFPDKPFSTTCPTRYWEEVRTNFLFVSQLYALYTLTTDLPYDFLHTNTEYGRSRVYVLGSLAVIECTAVCVAVAVQFDTIEGCAQLSWGVGTLVLVAAVVHVLRRVVGSMRDESACECHVKMPRRLNTTIWDAHKLLLKNVKLKL